MFLFYDMKFYRLIRVNIDSRFQSCREFLAWPAILITIQPLWMEDSTTTHGWREDCIRTRFNGLINNVDNVKYV